MGDDSNWEAHRMWVTNTLTEVTNDVKTLLARVTALEARSAVIGSVTGAFAGLVTALLIRLLPHDH